MRTFEVKSPNHPHHLRHQAKTLADIKGKLLKGYEIIGEVVSLVPASDTQMTFPIRDASLNDETVPTLVTMLLHFHGDELEAWMRRRMPAGKR